MSDVPHGWTGAKLGDLVELKYGKSLPEKSRVPGLFNVFGSNGPVGTHATCLTKGPTIVVGRKGSIGEVHYSSQPCFPIDTTYYVDRFDVCESLFALNLLRFLPLTELNRATAIPGLNREDAYELEVRLPPLPEQRRIVAKIDSLSTKSKRARDQLDHVPRLVEKYKQAIMASAFRGELTQSWRAQPDENPAISSNDPWPIPSEWKWLTVAGIGEISLGRQRSPKDHFGPQMRRYVRAANITWGGWSLTDVKEMNFDDSEFARFKLQAGDVLVNEGSGSAKEVGKPAIWNGEIKDCCFQNTLLRVRPTVCSSEFLHRYFLFSALTGLFVSSTQGVNIYHIGKDGLARFPIPLPPREEQDEIVRLMDKAFAWIDHLSSEASSARRLIDNLDQAVLAKAFRGELVPQDPDDEPASVLLERIRAERNATASGERHRPRETAKRSSHIGY